jgi:hypothetical protein
VFINDATYPELLHLPGVGPKVARSILRHRAENPDRAITEGDLWSIPYLKISRQLLEMISFMPAPAQRGGNQRAPGNVPGGAVPPITTTSQGGGGCHWFQAGTRAGRPVAKI